MRLRSHSSQSQLRLDNYAALSSTYRYVQKKVQGEVQNAALLCGPGSTTKKRSSTIKKAFYSTIWPKLTPAYKKLVVDLVRYCGEELAKRNLKCQVRGRAKAIESARTTVNRRERERQKPYTNLQDILYDMHDLAGAIIIVQSSRDVVRVNNFVSEYFRAVKEPTHWSRDRDVGQFWGAWFGSYESYNHHVTITEEPSYNDVIFEIQVTSFKDYKYNEFAHPWYYKRKNGALSNKDEMIMDALHGMGHLSEFVWDVFEILGEYMKTREKENRNMAESEHDNVMTHPRYSNNLPFKSGNVGISEPQMATSTQVLTRFLYDSRMVRNDCTNILKTLHPTRRQSAKTDIDEERVQAIQSHNRLRAWLSLDQSSMLLLDGRCASQSEADASLVSAKITSTLGTLHNIQDSSRIYPRIITLSFFCGQHRNLQNDAHASAAELALSLILQLVDQGKDIFTPESLQGLQEAVLPENISTVCSSLCNLIREIPRNVYVAIIIDNLKSFARPVRRQEQTEEVTKSLVSLYREKPHATLKLLFTSPPRDGSLEELFEEEEVLRLGRELPARIVENHFNWRRPIVL
jgi:ppGpp synthetase/RelA/SpoT-type nucleotidyltranferase